MTQTQQNTNPQRKKITAQIVKMADLKTGETVKGKYLGQSEREWFDHTDGQTKMIPQFHFEAMNQDKNRFNVFGDAGLKNAMSSAGVTEGQFIEIEKCDQKDIGNGRRVNSYEIYELN